MTTPYTVDSGWARLPDPTTLARIHDQTADGFFCDDPSIHRHRCWKCGDRLARHEPILVHVHVDAETTPRPTPFYPVAYEHSRHHPWTIAVTYQRDHSLKLSRHLTTSEYAQRWNLSIARHRNIKHTPQHLDTGRGG